MNSVLSNVNGCLWRSLFEDVFLVRVHFFFVISGFVCACVCVYVIFVLNCCALCSNAARLNVPY